MTSPGAGRAQAPAAAAGGGREGRVPDGAPQADDPALPAEYTPAGKSGKREFYVGAALAVAFLAGLVWAASRPCAKCGGRGEIALPAAAGTLSDPLGVPVVPGMPVGPVPVAPTAVPNGLVGGSRPAFGTSAPDSVVQTPEAWAPGAIPIPHIDDWPEPSVEGS